MEKIKDYAIVVDSTTIVPEETKAKIRIETVNLTITVDNVNKLEPEWTVEEIVAAQKAKKSVHSSCPSPVDFANAYEKLFQEGYKDILVIPMNKSISHTYESAKMGADTLDEDRKNHVVVLDVFEANYGIAMLVGILADYGQQGYTFEQILAKAHELIPEFHECWTMASLEPLFKGGRLSPIAFVIGTFLKIKPIIGINNDKGNLEAEKKVRTFNDVDKYFLEKIQAAVDKYEKVYLSFVRMGDEDLMKALISKVEEQFPDLQYTIFDGVGPLFTVHLGEAGYGIGFIGEGLKSKQDESQQEKKGFFDFLFKKKE